MKNLGSQVVAGSNIRESGESRRTTQFLIESECPQIRGANPALFGDAVWVFTDANANISACGHRAFRIDTRQRTAKGMRLKHDSEVKGMPPCVCEHMGHLIE